MSLLLGSLIALTRGVVPVTIAAIRFYTNDEPEAVSLMLTPWVRGDEDPLLSVKDGQAWATLLGTELLFFFVFYVYASFDNATMKATAWGRIAAGLLFLVGVYHPERLAKERLPDEMLIFAANDILTGVLTLLLMKNWTLVINFLLVFSHGLGFIFAPKFLLDVYDAPFAALGLTPLPLPKLAPLLYMDLYVVLVAATGAMFTFSGFADSAYLLRATAKASLTLAALFGYLFTTDGKYLPQKACQAYALINLVYGVIVMILVAAPKPSAPAAVSKNKKNK